MENLSWEILWGLGEWAECLRLVRMRKVINSPEGHPTGPTTAACLDAYRGKPALPEKCWDPWS